MYTRIFALPDAALLPLLRQLTPVPALYHLTPDADCGSFVPDGGLFVSEDLSRAVLDADEDWVNSLWNQPKPGGDHFQRVVNLVRQSQMTWTPHPDFVGQLAAIAETMRSRVALYHLHERGDMLYDSFAWVFDYATSEPEQRGETVYTWGNEGRKELVWRGSPLVSAEGVQNPIAAMLAHFGVHTTLGYFPPDDDRAFPWASYAVAP